jgi:hypothetical protein
LLFHFSAKALLINILQPLAKAIGNDKKLHCHPIYWEDRINIALGIETDTGQWLMPVQYDPDIHLDRSSSPPAGKRERPNQITSA